MLQCTDVYVIIIIRVLAVNTCFVTSLFHSKFCYLSQFCCYTSYIYIKNDVTSDTCIIGLVMFSVDHPDAPQPDKVSTVTLYSRYFTIFFICFSYVHLQDSRRINISPSGLILKCFPGPGTYIYDKCTVSIQLKCTSVLRWYMQSKLFLVLISFCYCISVFLCTQVELYTQR